MWAKRLAVDAPRPLKRDPPLVQVPGKHDSQVGGGLLCREGDVAFPGMPEVACRRVSDGVAFAV
jgi:hypothetical protein